MERNPYIGPRPFERSDRRNFYGREREARELQSIILAEREVLVYAPSGAGKTSLFNARIIPALEEQGIRVLPVARVGLDLPAGIRAEQVANIFVYSALLSLAGGDADPARLAGETLEAYLKRHLAQPVLAGGNGHQAQEAPDLESFGSLPHPPLLLFDQFEEIFTTHRDRWQEARGFFGQVRQALDEVPGLGVVFTMREDHVAGLDPYLAVFPNRLRARFRLELLGERGALQAISRPAQNAGLGFAPGVAERLADDLRRIKVQAVNEDAVETAFLGPVVEPVQLQVVCSQLWASLPDGKTDLIQWEEVEKYGNVDQALTNFYETTLRQAAQAGPVSEREIRRWIGSELITQVGTRGLAPRGPETTAGMPNAVIDVLENQHLIRAEVRAGARWYELSHDRLVSPIQASNLASEQSSETPLRAAARRWKETRSSSLLYRGAALNEANRWAKANPAEVEPFEKEFLEESTRAAAAGRRRWATIGISALVVLLLVLSSLTVWAISNANEANLARSTAVYSANLASTSEAYANVQKATAVVARDYAQEQQATAVVARDDAEAAKAEAVRQAELFRAFEFASQARSVLAQEKPQLSLLIAMQAVELARQNGAERFPAAEQVLRDVLGQVSGIPLQRHGDMVWGLAASPDLGGQPGRWLVTYSKDGSVRLWDLQSANPGEQAVVLEGHTSWVTSADISADGRWLVTASQDNTARLWDLSGAISPGQPPRSVELTGHSAQVWKVKFDPLGRWVITASYDQTVRLWDLRSTDPASSFIELKGQNAEIFRMAVSPDGRWLATGDKKGQVILWDFQQAGSNTSTVWLETGAQIDALNFSPDSRLLVTGDDRGGVSLLPVQEQASVPQLAKLSGHSGPVWEARFSPDGCWLATGGGDGRVFLWAMNDLDRRMAQVGPDGRLPELNYYALPQSSGSIYALAFPRAAGEQVRWLAAGGADNTARLWDLAPAAVRSSDCGYIPAGQSEPAALPDSRQVSFSAVTLRGVDGDIQELSFAANDRWLAAASADGSGRLWDVSTRDASADPRVLPSISTVIAAMSLDGHWLAQAGAGGLEVRSLAGDPASAVWRAPCGAGRASRIAAHPDNRRFAAGCVDGQVVTWDVSTLAGSETFKPTTLGTMGGQLTALEFSADGRWLAAGDLTGGLMAWPVDADGPFGQPVKIEGHQGVVRATFDPHNRWLASVGADGVVQLRDLENLSAAPLAALPLGEKVNTYVLAFSRDGRWFSAGTSTTQAWLWDLQDLSPGKTPPEYRVGDFLPGTVAWKLAFSPDSRWIAVGSTDSTLRLVDLSQLSQKSNGSADIKDHMLSLGDQEDWITSLAISPDNQWLLAGSRDRSIRMWRLDNPAQSTPLRLLGHQGTVNQMLYAPDGQTLYTVSDDRTLRVWRMGLDDLLQLACAQVNREMSAAEAVRYLHQPEAIRVCR